MWYKNQNNIVRLFAIVFLLLLNYVLKRTTAMTSHS